MSKTPTFSIIIPNHNSHHFLHQCLDSIYSQTFSSFEIIVIDNSSTDQSLKKAKQFTHNSNFHLIQLDSNHGAAQARNLGSKIAKGDFIFFLDSDTTLDSNCLQQIFNFLKTDPPDSALHPKLLSQEDKKTIDCAGNYLDSFGFLHNRGTGQIDVGQLDQPTPILAGKSAAVIIPRQIFSQVGGFDPDFYFLLEDTDLDWRLWLAGYSVFTLPQAVVYHGYNTSLKNQGDYYHNYPIQYFGSRNYIQTLIKNLCPSKLFTVLPLHILSWFGISLISLFRLNPGKSFQILSGIFWNLIFLPKTLKKRRSIQANRQVTDHQLNHLWISHQPLSSYIKKISMYTIKS